MESMDMNLIREYAERQLNDANRIIILCDALAKVMAEVAELKKQKAAAAPK